MANRVVHFEVEGNDASKKKSINTYSCVIGVEDIRESLAMVKTAGGKVLTFC